MEVRFKKVKVGDMELWECQLCKCKFMSRKDCKHHAEYHRLLREGRVDPPPPAEQRETKNNTKTLTKWLGSRS